MTDVETYRSKSDELLRLATKTTDVKERNRLISEAVSWHQRALEAESAGGGPAIGG